MTTASTFALAGSQKIQGASDNTLIGNVGDKLKVITCDENATVVYLKSTLNLDTIPGTSQDLINSPVPAGKTWKLRKILVVCRQSGKFDILVNGSVVGTGRTSPAESNVSLKFEPFFIANALETLRIKFLQSVGPAVCVEAFIYATET